MRKFSLLTAASGLLLASTHPSKGELKSASFLCSVQPGFGTSSMPLSIRVKPMRLTLDLLPTDPPNAELTIVEDSPTGLIAVSVSAFQQPSGQPFVGGSIFFIVRATGFIRWITAGADASPPMDRAGICVDTP